MPHPQLALGLVMRMNKKDSPFIRTDPFYLPWLPSSMDQIKASLSMSLSITIFDL
jgi:hypothetical protein